jgi:hypothetical protein
MVELFEFLSEFGVRLLIEGFGEWLGHRSANAIKQAQRDQRLGLRLVYASDRKLADVLLLDGLHAGKRLSELHPDIVMSLQGTWRHLVGRAAIARWLDRNRPGWRRTRRQQRRNAFIPEGPAR